MRTKFIAGVTRKQAQIEMAWASKIVMVVGGYLGFESIADYNTWRKQK